MARAQKGTVVGEAWEAWLYGADRYERNTRVAVESARADAARSQSHLASQLRRQQGDLQAQINQLTDAFVALLEYEDVRGELNAHADAATCRKYAREIVPNIVITGGSRLAELPAPPEVHNYWLSWAVRGLVATAIGGDGDAQLAQALQLDEQRTSLLLVLIDAIRREPRYGSDCVEAALPRTATLTRVERVLWIAIAEGRLGEPAPRRTDPTPRHPARLP